jgi:hypothetical protein
MPRGDRTGPWGYGPMTGRGVGFCAGYPHPGYMHPGPGFGYGGGFRRRYRAYYGPAWPAWAPGYAPYFYGPAVPNENSVGSEKDYLVNQAEMLKEQLEQINKRLDELEDK